MLRYARVENGKIVEPFVTGVQIQNRGHHTSIYSKVEFEDKPETNQFQTLREVLKVADGKRVIATYEIEQKSIDRVLQDLHEANADESGQYPDLYISDVDPIVAGYVLEQVKKRVSDKLAVFAKARDYDDIVSLASYATSTIPKFAEEGQRGVYLRDLCFASLYAFQMAMVKGEKFVPKSLVEIDENLPAMTWED